MSRAKYTMDEILDMAITREIEAQELYRMMSGRVKEAHVRDELLGLVSFEMEHQAILEKYRRDGLPEGWPGPGQAVDWKITDGMDQPAVTPEIPLKDVFLLAAHREKNSHDFYLRLAGLFPPGLEKTLFKQLAAAEAQHKSRVELLYSEVAFPQTDGG